MIGRDGAPMTDPRRADDAFLLPIGGYKGFGLSFVFGVLAGTLNGAAFGEDVVDMNADAAAPTNTGQFICVLDVARFGDLDAFKRQMDAVVGQMKASPPMAGFDGVRMPGEAAAARIAARARDGIPLPAPLLARLNETAAEVGVDKLG